MLASCMLCSDTFGVFDTRDKTVLGHLARDVLQGMLSTAQAVASNPSPLLGMRRGLCVVERCARAVEAPCGGCRETACQRCLIAAELRAAETRINAERDTELAQQITDQDLDVLIDGLVKNLCEKHAAFGSVLFGEWYAVQIRRRRLRTDRSRRS